MERKSLNDFHATTRVCHICVAHMSPTQSITNDLGQPHQCHESDASVETDLGELDQEIAILEISLNT